MKQIFFFLIAICCLASTKAQVQIGNDIDGETAGDESGTSVSLDGNRLAIGAPNNDGNGSDAGHVRIYERNGSTWNQLGNDIDGEAAGDESGTSVSLNGNRVAIGAPKNDGNGSDAGHVRIYEWNGSAWTQLGNDIDGEATTDQSGWSVSLDGNRVAIGAPNSDGVFPDAGHVRIYEWNGSAWTQLGNDIDGEGFNDDSGWSVSLDGNRVAIGAPNNDGTGTIAGHVRIYEWNGSAWTQLGNDIDGEAASDKSGWSVSLDGNRLAIGAHWNTSNGIGPSVGHVRIYEWNGSAWTQLGNDIDGEVIYDFSGSSVSLDSNQVAIGAHGNDGNGSDAGHVRIYEWNGNAWAQLGIDIDGEAILDKSGYSVSLDGNQLAIGAPNNDENGSDAGHIRIYDPSIPTVLNKTESTTSDIFVFPTPTNDNLHIRLPSINDKQAVVRLTNTQGSVVYNRKMQIGQDGLIQIKDLRTLTTGVYIIDITTQNGKIYSHKFLKK